MNETRKIAAILVADVIGYSRLVGADEDRTLARLRALRSDLIDPTIAVHNGRVVKRTGDGAIVEFRSVIDAVRCAIEVQSGMIERNAGLPPERRIEFRVGIHLGDVVEESDGDLMGDGVNIAARLEGICEAGGICVSEDAYRQVRDKIKEQFVDLGERVLKNIARPFRAYHMILKRGEPAAPIPREPGWTPLALPDKPSLAVLPFENMSGDAEQDYFADGIVEDIITALSCFRSFAVIARNSSFVYKGRSVDVRQVARELGVRYVLEGSVRKAGNRVRITGQLIDASTGAHLWAERFEGGLEDIFDLQDRVTARVVGAIAPKVEQAEIQRAQRKPTESLDAYDYFLRGRECFAKGREADAVPYFQRAAELDPNYSGAHAHHAVSLIGRYWSDQSPETFQQALTAAKKAISIDSNDAWCQHAMGFVLLFGRQHSLAGIHFERAQKLNPADTMIVGDWASWSKFGGRPEEALRALDAAMMRDPFPPIWFWHVRGSALFDLQHYEEAVSAFQQRISEGSYLSHAFLAAAYAMVGDIDNARRQAELALVIQSDFSVKKVSFYLPYTDQAALDRYLDAMRMAGLPE